MSKQNIVYPVYILENVVKDIVYQCKITAPNEMMGRLLGYRCQWQDHKYTKVIDCVTATLDNGPTHARFTSEGIRECELLIDERYGNCSDRPTEIGIYHSHPFNSNPHFSSVDDRTFLSFPYNLDGNVFVLTDPLSGYFKVFVIATEQEQKCLKQVPWICYSPQIQS